MTDQPTPADARPSLAPAPQPPPSPDPLYDANRLLRELRHHVPGGWSIEPMGRAAIARMEANGVQWSAVIDATEPGVLLTAWVGDAEFDSSAVADATVADALAEVRRVATDAARRVCGVPHEVARS